MRNYVQDMIANELPDESLAQAIACFLADHIDSQSTEDFSRWAHGMTPEEAANQMTLRGANAEELITSFLATDDLDAFAAYAAENFPALEM